MIAVRASSHTRRQVVRILSGLVAGLIILIGVWELLTLLTHLPPLVFKSPAAVFSYLFTGTAAASHRSGVLGPLAVTLRDAVIGYVLGSLLALAVSCLFSLSVIVEGIVLPVAMLMQSVPILAVAPLLTVAFGRGLGSVVVICTTITFLPTLLTVSLGLRSAPAATADVVAVYGGGRWFFLRRVALPSATPALFAAMRLAAPTSIVGALLAEFLATGRGIGYLLATAQSSYDFGQIWAAVALVGISGLLFYAVVSLIEVPVLARFDAEAFEV